MLPEVQKGECEFCNKKVICFNGYCLRCQPVSYGEVVGFLEEQFYKRTFLSQSLSEKEKELQTERETAQEALRTGQEWHERQKAEIIAQWKGKLTNLLTARKQKLRQEIQLIREVLNE